MTQVSISNSSKQENSYIRSLITLLILHIFSLNSGLSLAASSAELDRVKRAVVKIHTTTNSPDYFTPWSMLNSSQINGSGSIIENSKGERQILTNAHVIADASFIQVQRHADPKKYRAKVAFVSHETDLAILTVKDDSFYKNSVTLRIGALPNPQDEVHVFGFPQGGTTLSITKGVMSRVEHSSYAHGDGFFLAGQIDAAVNPGNSGGPVIANQKIAGVVMQANFGASAENQGYFVPPSIIRHVLKDTADGKYDGFRRLGFSAQNMESPSLRAFYGLKDNQTGVMVTDIAEGSPAEKKLKRNDVVLKIGDYEIADDRTINFRKGQRTHYKYALDQYHFDDDVPLTIIREGKVQKIVLSGLPTIQNSSLVRDQRFDELPDYYIYGGVVFVPLNMNLIQRWGSDWHRKAPLKFLQQRYVSPSKDRTEAVVALNVLPARVNLGYHDWNNWIIDTVNNKKVRDFGHLVSILEENKETFVQLNDSDGYQLILNHQEAIDSRDSILKRYRIPNYYSMKQQN